MVLEAFAALSLTANIVQFIDFSSKLISNARQVHRSKNGFIEGHADLESATKSLKRIVHDLSTSSATMAAAVNVTEDEKELADLAEGCSKLAEELVQLFLKLRGTGPSNKFKSFVQAIKIFRNENQINLMKDRLNHFQTRMILCLSKILNGNQSILVRMLADLSDQMAQRDADMGSLLTTKTIITDGLESLKNSMDVLDNKADKASSKLASVATALSSLATKGSLIATESRFLESMCFRSMKVRHAQIPEAHKKTFEWAYTSRNTSDQSSKQFQFAEWLRSGNGIYWVTGKPGSGKSTLIKFLYDDPRTTSELKHWAFGKDIVTAAFFFWNSGTEMEKSIEGLLRSLLFEILRKCPSLIPRATPKRWENCATSSPEATAPWSQWELKEAFEHIQQQTELSAKFCLFIDGLDEYEGDHSRVIDILHGFAKSQHIKICLSSRPWNIFQEAFGQDPQNRLYLEDLTKPDIELFVRDTFESNPHFMTLQEMDTRYQAIIDQIVKKADGVFLWVYLIVRSLVKRLLNCDSLSELQRRIQLLPSKLEDYFLRILTTTDETYSISAAEIFEMAHQATYPLSLITYCYIEEDANFGFASSIQSLTNREVIHRLSVMRRRLNARSNGLLEVVNFDDREDMSHMTELFRIIIDDFGCTSNQIDDIDALQHTSVHELFRIYRIQFLHRTVHDFLETREIQNMLKSRLLNQFNPFSAICRAMLSQIKDVLPLTNLYLGRILSNLLSEMIHHAQESEIYAGVPQSEVLDNLEYNLRVQPPVPKYISNSPETPIYAPHDEREKGLYQCMVNHGLCGYIAQKLATSRNSLPSIEKLLAAALSCEHTRFHDWTYHLPMIQILIDSSMKERTPAWVDARLPRLWMDFLKFMPSTWNQISEQTRLDQLRIIQLLISIGADPNQKQGETVLWAQTLNQIYKDKILGFGGRLDSMSVSGDLRVFEMYKKTFFAYDVDQSLVVSRDDIVRDLPKLGGNQSATPIVLPWT